MSASTRNPNQVPVFKLNSTARGLYRGQRVVVIDTTIAAKGLVFRVVGEHQLHDPDHAVYEVRPHLLDPA